MSDAAPNHIVAACALIRNDRGEIALVRTDRRGWELPGGQIEVGETLTEGLRQMLRDEDEPRYDAYRTTPFALVETRRV